MINSIETGRKEDGNRSIADKIKKRLHDLDKTIESNFGRWIWELLQNAKDSIADEVSRTISVEIELHKESVVFRHNGSYFTELDIRGLINQISSKEVDEGAQSKKVGRFGTGFLTTHLLSKKVNIKGVVKSENNEFYSFDFLLDRDGQSIDELSSKVEQTWTGFQNSTQKIDITDIDGFKTSFTYHLDVERQQKIASRGIKEFYELIPYVLTFIPKIKDVKIILHDHSKVISYKKSTQIIDNIQQIQKSVNENSTDIFILKLENEKISIATEIEKKENGYSVKSIEKVPKIFCDFPLIGSENFHFPVVINSFFFSPKTERDGIWLTSNDEDDEVIGNKQLIESAFKLFQDLVNQIAEENFFDLYNLCNTKTPDIDDKNWYSSNIQQPLREFLKQSKIVETNKGKTSIEEVNFPDKNQNKENREKLWQFSYDLKVNALPKKEHIQKWADVIWDDCKKVDINDIVTDLKKNENITKLAETLQLNQNQTFEWLNDYIEFVSDNGSQILQNYEITPNQEGDFKSCKSLWLDEIEDETLKEIAKLAGYNYYQELVHKDLFIKSEQCSSKRILDDVAREITTLLQKETESEDSKKAITKLIQWFDDNAEKSQKYFSNLYNKKEKLLVDTIGDKESLYLILNGKMGISEVANLVKEFTNNPQKIQNSINKADELDSLLSDFNVSSVDELKKIIKESHGNYELNEEQKTQIEITQDVLASLGVTTQEELEEALKDKKISQQFIHTSIPTQEMFKYAQEKIQRAKKNVLKYLDDHDDYDCSDYEELSSTVIGNIKKHGQAQVIVVRPSDNRQVIIYYGSEKDSLAYDNAELWIDDGKSSPRHLQLGEIIKNTGITRIPLWV